MAIKCIIAHNTNNTVFIIRVYLFYIILYNKVHENVTVSR